MPLCWLTEEQSAFEQLSANIGGRISFGRLLLSSASVIEVHYQQQKQQTEKYYQTGRLDRLKQNLNSLTEYPRQKNDIFFAVYIKEKTGYQIDIFESVQRRVNTVIEQNQIRNKKELSDVGIMLDVYKQHPIDLNKLNILKGLLIEFSKQTGQKKLSRHRAAGKIRLGKMWANE